MKELKLTLRREAFEVMITGEKVFEFRKHSEWIRSRLIRGGKHREYDQIRFTNGYGADRPYFVCEYKGFSRPAQTSKHVYSNGLVVEREAFDWIIVLGRILEVGNLPQEPGLIHESGFHKWDPFCPCCDGRGKVASWDPDDPLAYQPCLTCNGNGRFW